MAALAANKKDTLKHVPILIVFAASMIAALLPAPRVAAAELKQRSIRISNTEAAQNNVAYRVGFTTTTTTTVGSIRVEFCSNSSLVDDSCVAPVGFDISGAAFASQFGMTGFSITSNTTANELVLGRPPVSETPVASSYNFTGVVNPFTGGSYFVRIYTYPTSDGSGAYADAGGLALYFTPSFGVTTVVPPQLTFCLGESITGLDCSSATEPFSDVGILGPLVTGVAQSQMLASTNADGGYTIWVYGGTMTSGNNTIPALTAGGTSQKGVSQFGINLRANTSPIIGSDAGGPGVATVAAPYDVQNQFRFQSGDIIATSSNPDEFRKFTVSYIINTAASQPGGIYATTLTYVVLANF